MCWSPVSWDRLRKDLTLRCPKNGIATSLLSSQYRYKPKSTFFLLPFRSLSYRLHCTYVFKVISGQQLPKVNIKEDSIVDPLVRVEIYGVPIDQAKQETRYIENNGTGDTVVPETKDLITELTRIRLLFLLSTGFNPVWYDTLRFTIHTPELAMVRFVVEDYDKTSKNDFVGQYTLPLSCMQQGMVEKTTR